MDLLITFIVCWLLGLGFIHYGLRKVASAVASQDKGGLSSGLKDVGSGLGVWVFEIALFLMIIVANTT